MTQISQLLKADIDDEYIQLFLHKLRHDLRNTVRPLVEIPEWIREDYAEDASPLPEPLHENLDMLEVYANRLSRMIEDLLVYAHVNQGDTSTNTSLTDLIADLTSETLPPEFQFTTDLSQDTLPIPDADAIALLDALLSNAVKHHDRSSGKIRVTCKRLGATTQLTVADDGPGLESKNLDKVFDPLTTLASRDQVEGSGMGLTIVRRIAQAHGGRTKAISTPGKRGTCIVVWFN